MIGFGLLVKVEKFIHPLTPYMSPGIDYFTVSSGLFIWVGLFSILTSIYFKIFNKKNN